MLVANQQQTVIPLFAVCVFLWLVIMKRNGSKRRHTVLYSGNARFGIAVSSSVDLCGLLEHSTAAPCAFFWPPASHIPINRETLKQKTSP